MVAFTSNTTGKFIYLCGTRDVPVAEAEPVFYEAESLIREFFPGAQVWNPARQVLTYQSPGSLRDYLHLSLPFLVDASDLLVRLPGWSTSIAARAEHTLAVALDIDVVSLRWKNNNGAKWYRIMELAPPSWDERDV